MIEARDWEALIKRHARAFHYRLVSAGISSISAEDVEQECWIGWIRARDTFDETRGVPFEAYLVEGLNRVKLEVRRKAARRYPEESGASLALDSKQGDEDLDLHEIIPSRDEEIGLDMERDQQVERLCRRLSPRAAAYVRLLYQQPAELFAEFSRIKRRAEHANSLGVVHQSPSSISSALIFKAMGAPRQERTKINNEILQAIERLK